MTIFSTSIRRAADSLTHSAAAGQLRHRTHQAVALAAGLLLCPWASYSSAQESKGTAQETPNAIARFAGTYWSQIYPSRDYDRGCAIGFLSFEFQPTGYFIFNRKITGSWRIDELGNLKLRTKQGETLKLIVNNDTLQATSDLGIVKRANLYQKCPA